MAEKVSATRFKSFAGLRNTVALERFDPSDLVIARNLDIDESGRLFRRDGYTSMLGAVGAHSLSAEGDLATFVQGTSLKRLWPDYSTTVLRSVTADLVVRYQSVIGRTYYSNGVENGVIEGGASRSWGITPPSSAGVATASAGMLPAGRYQWTMTFVRFDGQESGALVTGAIDLPDNSGISFSNLPVSSDTDIAYKVLYLTPTNGEVFYEALTVLAAATTASYINDGVELTRPLETLHLKEPPAGNVLGYYRGHMLVAVGAFLFYSKPYAYELFDLRDYLNFDGAITLIAPVEDGIYVCTQTHHYWLPGLTPAEWSLNVKAVTGAIPGSLTYVEGRDVGEGRDGRVALWLSQAGTCMGANGGAFAVLNSARLNMNINRNEGATIAFGGRVISAVQ